MNDQPSPFRVPESLWQNCLGRPSTMVREDCFRFLDQEGEIKRATDWNNANFPKLWLYNLHYFDDLRAQDASQRADWHDRLIGRWIAENPYTPGRLASVGWEPYPSSLRIVNWIAWALARDEIEQDVQRSLVVQIRRLARSLEFHLLANHLLANAKALVFGGCFFASLESKRWLTTGLALLDRELREQILADGAHFELSPMYHSTILEDILDLIQLSRLYPEQLARERSSQWDAIASRMLSWLADMTHPDGDIALFNDATFGVARRFADLERYAASLDVAASRACDAFPAVGASGYLRLQRGPFCVIFDAAEIGPSYQPGHGHADVLSFELSVDQCRLITNSGVSTYDIGAIRNEERATAAHATVEIDSRSSSEMWASFRVGRRAHPFGVIAEAENDSLRVTASHDGYRWLPGTPVHRRSIALTETSLGVTDTIMGAGHHTLTARFPLDPSLMSVEPVSRGWKLTTSGGRVVRTSIYGNVNPFVESGSYAPTFGRRLSRPVIGWRCNARLPITVETRFEL